MNSLQTWVINLDRAPERLARISGQLQALSLPFTRMAAVDARALTTEQSAALDGQAYRRKHGMAPVLGELGCYLSHVQAMRLFLASDAAFAMVLEDDALLHASLLDVLQGLIAHAHHWDVVKLSGVHSGTPVSVLPLTPQHSLAVMLSRCTGSSAYVMNRRAAQSYLQGLLPMSLPYDHVFDQGWRFQLRVRLATPTPCRHDACIATTIDCPAGPPRKFRWWQRWAAYRYRAGNEWRRVLYALGEVFNAKAGRKNGSKGGQPAA